MTNVFNLFVSKNLKKYWINSDKNNFDDLLIKSMKRYLQSVDYKKTSVHHKLAIIKILKIIEESGNKESSSEFQFNNPNFHSDFSNDTISEIISFIELCEIVRYAPTSISDSMNESLIKAEQIIEKIERT